MESELSTPDVEGIYETGVPLELRALAGLGCLARLSPKAGRSATADLEEFRLDELERRTGEDGQAYLPSASIRHLFLYHYQEDRRSVWALLIPALRSGTVWLQQDRVLPAESPALHSLFAAERAKKLLRDTAATVPKDGHNLHLRLHTSRKDVAKELGGAMREYLSANHGPTFLAVLSPLSTSELGALAPPLRDLPNVKLHISDGTQLFSNHTFHWERVGCIRMLQHYMNSYLYLDSYVGLARYLSVPLGNVPPDHGAWGADLLFARELTAAGHVLWASPTTRPDLGGKEMDDNRLSSERADAGRLAEREGLYASVCVELDLGAVPVSALLQSHAIAEKEGAASAIGFDSAGPASMAVDEMVAGGNRKLLASYDEGALCAPAFRVLKHLVHAWVRDIAERHNEYADDLVQHFYRWLLSPSSLLYDPALKRALQQLMKKLTLLLVAEITALGGVVLHATFSRLIVCTKKTDPDAARTWLNYAIKQLQDNHLFRTVDLEPRQTWRLLLWLDFANFAAISTQDSNQPQETHDDDDDGTPAVEMNWNLADYLPEEAALGCRTAFNNFIAGFLILVHRFIQQRDADAHNDTLRRAPESQEKDPGKVKDEDEVEEEVGKRSDGVSGKLTRHCRQLVEGELSERLLGLVERVGSVGGGGAASAFPSLPGSHLELSNPGLELVKAVCRVVGLDEGLRGVTEKAKRDALRLLGVGAFAAEAEWREPCLAYVLPQVVCSGCNHFRDVDLCRDPHIATVRNADSGAMEGGEWRCAQCRLPYPKGLIEDLLLLHLNQISMGYTLQDLQCVKCKAVSWKAGQWQTRRGFTTAIFQMKEGEMEGFCECSGEYRLTHSHSELLSQLKTFDSLSKLLETR